jgi:hypothetical protein
MPYKRKTPQLGIPYPCHGDMIEEEQERIRAMGFESLLLAASRGLRSYVLSEGQFSIDPINSSMWDVRIDPVAGKASLSGAVGNSWVYTDKPLIWKNLRRAKYWLYIGRTLETYSDPSDVRCVVARKPLTNNSAYMLIAYYDAVFGDPVVNTEPDGKVYVGDYSTHISDADNPHGRILTQDSVFIRDELVFEDSTEPCIKSDGAISIKDANATVNLTETGVSALKTDSQSIMGAINEVSDRIVVKKALTGGPKGVTIDAGRLVVYATASRTGEALDGVLGELSFDYNGNIVTMRNSGDSDIPVKVCMV